MAEYFHWSRRYSVSPWWTRLGLATMFAMSAGCAQHQVTIPTITGVVWQPDNQAVDPRGSWQQIGATELLVQWTAVDGIAFVANKVMPTAAQLPAWQRIADEPWAQGVIVGLAGRFDENAARADIAELSRLSAELAKLPTPLKVLGWYFPVEIDPTWNEAASLAPLLESLPRPLWISVYDSANVGPEALAQGLDKWLPKDVGVFFQDGVGVHAREARVARQYADMLSVRLGRNRVRIIAEAFRPQVGGGFRSATIAELGPQLAQYDNYRIYLFEGPRYVSDALVGQIRAGQVKGLNVSSASH